MFSSYKKLCEAFDLCETNISLDNKVTYDFEDLHGIPYVLEAIDKSLIRVITPSWDCRRKIFLALFEGVVAAQCKFFNYDFG